uniref:Golgi SNAP receptor complex member 1 n=1 Tax=Timema cristinae TaxID=61476 RepID=A0A7R9H1U1_TIMCR|nr:unnamed protein product [Timema cristinae]
MFRLTIANEVVPNNQHSPGSTLNCVEMVGRYHMTNEIIINKLEMAISSMPAHNVLSQLNEQMGEISSSQTNTSSGVIHTMQRHREILQDYKQEFHKTRSNYQARREKEELLKSVRKDIDSYKSSGLNRRMDLYLKENEHIRSSDRLIDDQISIAVETRDHLVSQRLTFKRFQTKINDISNRFPVVNSLLQRINIRKRRDSIIIGPATPLPQPNLNPVQGLEGRIPQTRTMSMRILPFTTRVEVAEQLKSNGQQDLTTKTEQCKSHN